MKRGTMKKIVIIMAGCAFSMHGYDNGNAQNNVVQIDTRFHSIQERYPTIKAYGMRILGSNADGSITLLDGFNGSWDKSALIALTSDKNRDYFEEENKKYYNGSIFIDEAFYLHKDQGEHLGVLSSKNNEWSLLEHPIESYSAVCKGDANEIFLAHANGKISCYTTPLLAEKASMVFKDHWIKSMVYAGNTLIAACLGMDGIYRLDLKNGDCKKILSKFYNDNFIISPSHQYLMIYYHEIHNLNTPVIDELRIFDLSKMANEGKTSSVFSIGDHSHRISDYSFLPGQDNFFLVIYGNILKQGCAIYSRESKSKIVRIHTDYPISWVLYPSSHEILLKFRDSFDALLINKTKVLMTYFEQLKESKKSGPTIIGRKNTVWSRMTEEEKDVLVYGYSL